MQLHLPLRSFGRRGTAGRMVPSRLLKRQPALFLPQALHISRSGTPRVGADAGLLAAGLRRRRIRMDDLYAPLPSALLGDHHVTAFLAGAPRRQESDSHARLKLYARLVAGALLPCGRITMEQRLRLPAGTAIPDVCAMGSDLRIACEVGATDGRKICFLLEAGLTHCIVLPFASLSDWMIRGYVFRHANTPPLRPIAHAETTNALVRIKGAGAARRERHNAR